MSGEQTIRKSALSGGRWLLFATFFQAGLHLSQLLILARLLTPADFGVVAIVSAFVAITVVFSDFGMSGALIHYPKPNKNILSSLYWFNLIIALVMASTFISIAGAVSDFYNKPDLLYLFWIYSLVFPLGALGAQFKTLTEKELRFSAVVKTEICGAVLGFVVTLLMAAHGYGAYSLALGTLVSVATTSLLCCFYLSRGNRPVWHFDFKEVHKYIHFGGYHIAGTIAHVLRMQTDLFICGYVASSSAMGVYSVTRELSLKVINGVNPVVARIGLPIMAKLPKDKQALRNVYLQTVRMTTSITFPIYIIMVVFSDEVVVLVLGRQWGDGGFYLSVFALWGMVRSISNSAGSLLYAIGQVRKVFWWNLKLLVLFFSVLWGCSVFEELEWLANSILILQLLVILPTWRYLVFPACGASLKDYIAQFLPAGIAIGISAILGWGITAMLFGLISSWANLIVSIAIILMCYLVISFWINRPWILMISELFLLLRRK